MSAFRSKVKGQLMRVKHLTLRYNSWLNGREEEYILPSLKTFEQQLLDAFVISVPFEDHVKGKVNEKRRRYSLLLILFYVIIATRSLVLMATGDPLLIDLLGDTFWAIGKGGKLIHLMLVSISYITITQRVMIYWNEKRKRLHFLVDFIPLIRGTSSLGSVGLTLRHYKKLKVTGRVLAKLLKGIQVISLVTCIPMFTVIAGVAAKAKGPSLGIPTLVAYFFWALIMNLWVKYFVDSVICMDCCYYISTEYLIMRYKQLNVRLRRPFRAPDPISRAKEMMHIIVEHKEITRKVFNYNHAAKWILYLIYFICAPMASVALYVSLFVRFEVPFITEALVVVCIEILASVFLFSIRGAGVHKQAHLGYQYLNSMVATLEFQSVGMKLKLQGLIETYGGQPVAYYCLNMFPFTYETFMNFITSSISFFLLVNDSVDKILGI